MDGQQVRLLGAISEIAGLAGWLHADLAEPEQARRFYRMSVSAAARAGHPLLPIYMQGSLGQYATTAGDPAQGLRLIPEAAGRLPRSAPRIAWAWLCALEGVVLSYLGDRSALGLLDQAERHADTAQDEEPVWPWVFRFEPTRSQFTARSPRRDCGWRAWRLRRTSARRARRGLRSRRPQQRSSTPARS
ncbi:hypothetical protein GCM10023317_94010 [Actinopolymorpha pittospori]